MGSPPLVRERHLLTVNATVVFGITPARAGKTDRPGWQSHSHQDHPRSCGKDRRCTGLGLRLWGSPPLVRERRIFLIAVSNGNRITPARAGKTRRRKEAFRLRRDHPRSCGKDSNGFLYLRHFALAGIQNLFNFFAEYLSTKKHKARFAKIQLSQPPI